MAPRRRANPWYARWWRREPKSFTVLDDESTCATAKSLVREVTAGNKIDWSTGDRDFVGRNAGSRSLGNGFHLHVSLEIYPSEAYGYRGRGRTDAAVVREIRAGDAELHVAVTKYHPKRWPWPRVFSMSIRGRRLTISQGSNGLQRCLTRVFSQYK